MSDLKLLRYDSLDELRCNAAAWDDLWRRSFTTRPVARAATVAHWIEQFAPGSRFSALVVSHNGRLTAGLPLIGQRIGRVLQAGCMPHNAWSPAGDLLLDQDCDPDVVVPALVEGLGDLPWQIVWLDHVPLDAAHWRAFRDAVAAAGAAHACRHLCSVGRIDAHGDWEEYRRSWSKNHRRKMSKAIERLVDEAPFELELHTPVADDDIEPLLRRAFEIEDCGWKGRAGTSVLRSPGMFQFFLDQAQLLSANGELGLALLNHDGQSIAFDYGLRAKGAYHSLKVGYDERFARYSPGQLLTHALLERFFRDPAGDHVDFMGPMVASMKKWRPQSYSLGRLVIAPPSLLGRVILHAYSFWWPRIGAILRKR